MAPAQSVFDERYSASRARFRLLAQQAGADWRAYPLDDTGDAGDTDDALSIDTARLGDAEAETLIVVASGIHGIEGHAGAVCQHRLLETLAARGAPAGVAFLLVHAVNPWGFRHGRRVTAEGVDLNRNFIDFPPLEIDPGGYAAYHDRLVSRYRPGVRGWINEAMLLREALRPGGARRVQEAVTAGQYAIPDGLFYGGSAPVASRRVWERIVAQQVGETKAPRAVLLDLHTGLGRRGRGTLLSTRPSASDAFREMNRWCGGALTSMADGAAISAALRGTLTAAFERGEPGRRYAIGLEFGTRAPLAVLNALRADQWAWRRTGLLNEPQRARARQAMRDAFAPDDPAWLASVLADFDAAIAQLVDGLRGVT